MEKIIVHSVKITKPKEKNIFQIVLPENTEAITGIASTTDKARLMVGGKMEKVDRASGTLQLFAADTGEHLFSDNPKVVNSPCWMQPFDMVFPIRAVPLYKTHFGLLDTWQRVQTTIIDAYYMDLIGYVIEDFNYTLRVYVRVQLRKPCT